MRQALLLGLIVAAVTAGAGASQTGSHPRTIKYVYTVQISGSATFTAKYNTYVVNGTGSETVNWTTTIPPFKLVVKPTRRLGKIPPGYEMDGRSKSGSSQISVHLARHGQYENCDWGASYERKTWFRVDGNPTYNSLGWYVLDLAERRASYDTEEPMPDPQGACGSGEFGTGVAAKDAHARFEGETGADRSLTDLARWYRTKQPRTRLSYPINVLRAGKNLTLHATGSEDNESYTLSGTVTIKFIRKHG